MPWTLSTVLYCAIIGTIDGFLLVVANDSPRVLV